MVTYGLDDFQISNDLKTLLTDALIEQYLVQGIANDIRKQILSLKTFYWKQSFYSLSWEEDKHCIRPDNSRLAVSNYFAANINLSEESFQ